MDPGMIRRIRAGQADASSSAEAGTLLLAEGLEVGPVRLGQLLGGGATGQVWSATRIGGGAAVAIKFLVVDHPEALARFLREARIAAALDHPHVARVQEAGEHHGVAWLLQDLVSGASLAGKTLPREDAARVLRDGADALRYAHGEGFIHRDLKPGNLVRRDDGATVVIDFGLARAVEQATKLTRTGTVLGTPQYMAPEQAMGHAADARSDLYALGACLYTLLAGRPPFRGENAVAIVRQVASVAPTPLPETDDLARIVNRCMARERADRYPDAATLLEDVEAFRRGDPLPSAKRGGFWSRLFGD